MAALLDGPRAGSADPRQLVVLLHGFGADGRDLVSLGRQWAQLLPDAAIVAPNAPEPCPGTPGGRQWFPQWHLAFGVGHGIDEGALGHAGLFLARAFGLRTGSGPVGRER